MPMTMQHHMPNTPLVDSRERLRTSLRHLEAVQAGGRHWALAEAHHTVAGAYRELGAWPSALANLQAARRWAQAGGARDLDIDIACTLVETLAGAADAAEHQQRGGGRPLREQARDVVFDTAQELARVADAQREVGVLLRLSDVLDRFGDRDDATQLQMRALQRTVGETPVTTPRAVDAAASRAH
ncbi:hypothetical protein ENE75_06925 [Rubrivivax albus]|uniref:Tetratricopeptide repeat protein n=2 Tax=Rubrivivax albus TaxID=2499835 RepID=A0A3S2X1V9_9BURK|nr:hypothetical protein ENE75_06925 [Rubrivivax albus]